MSDVARQISKCDSLRKICQGNVLEGKFFPGFDE